jgi:hypothetical protein
MHQVISHELWAWAVQGQKIICFDERRLNESILFNSTGVELKLSLVFLVMYFALLWLGMSTKTIEMTGRWWFFLRAFFPNWKFFHALGMAPRLYVHFKVRSMDSPSTQWSEWSAWVLVYPRVQRRVQHLLHNPEVNLRLGYQNLVEHLVADLNALPEGADASLLVTYRLVSNLARNSLLPYLPQNSEMHYQFEIRMEEPWLNHPNECLQSEIMLVSREMAL